MKYPINSLLHWIRKTTNIHRCTKEDLNFHIPKKYRTKGIMQDLMLHCAVTAARMNKIPQLFVDKQNPISNHAYRQIGFEVYLSNYCYKYRE